MPVYVALLRGVNVGSHKRMSMERLRASFEALGFNNVQTVIQSGNVIFSARKQSTSALCEKIEAKILKDFGFPAPVVVRTREELGTVIERNPFFKAGEVDGAKLHLAFLPAPPTTEALAALAKLTTEPDKSHCHGAEIYLHLPNGMAKSSLMNNPVERKWLKGATVRNWNTVTKIYALCQACE